MSNFAEMGNRSSRSQRKPSSAQLRILLVDDEHGILEILKSALSLSGNYKVSVSDSAENAVRQINRADTPFDLLMFDINMPNVNGITLCKTVRKIPGYRETPIIMLTAMTDRKFVDEAFIAGATDYVTKPFDFLEIRSRLRAAERLVLECKRARRGLAVAQKLKAELDATDKSNLDDPISIDGIDRILGFSEFDNYVMQLSQGKSFFSFATAIKITDVEHMHAALPYGEFRKAVRDVALGLVQTTKRTGEIFSYRGGGVFLCVTHGRNLNSSDLSEETLNRMIATLHAQRQGTAKIRVVIGEPVSMRSLTKSGTLISLNKAISCVLSKDDTEEDVALRSASAGNRGIVDTHDSRSRFGVFDSFFRDLFHGEPVTEKNLKH